MKRQPIRNVTHNFTEEDINGCESLEQLRDWHRKVKADIHILKAKYKNGKEKQEYTGGVDSKWLDKLQYVIDTQNILLELIESRIISMRNTLKEPFFVEMNFVEEARRVLDEDLFNEILTKAKLGDGQEDTTV